MRTGKRLLHGLVIGISVCICLTSALAIPTDSQSAAYSILHDFAGGATDGFQPFYGGPALSGSTLYGMTQGGRSGPGYAYYGELYQINTDGTGYHIMHDFASGSDGSSPRGGLTLSGSTLYGCTEYGGGSNGGTIFRIDTNGSGYQVLKRFAMGDEQCFPYGAPVVSGATLYGMHSSSGNGSLKGAIFAMNLEGGDYRLLHEFAGSTSDGAIPYGSLTLVGSTLYGMTYYGGQYGSGSGNGIIFSLNLDTSEYKVLHNFEGSPNDGKNPSGSLTLVGSKLYGMTSGGGSANGPGVIFSINLDGGSYQVVVDFSNVSGAISGPLGSLTLVGSRLYGMTSGGGPGGASGVIFRVNPDGTGFKILHGFMSSPGDGGYPMGDVTFAGSRLFGWTYGGGSLGKGVFFSYQIPPPETGMLQLLLLE
jgi:uncharacterized repeat protein (TIGR03803 family)